MVTKFSPITSWRVLEKQTGILWGNSGEYVSLAKLTYLLGVLIPNLVFMVLQIL